MWKSVIVRQRWAISSSSPCAWAASCNQDPSKQFFVGQHAHEANLHVTRIMRQPYDYLFWGREFCHSGFAGDLEVHCQYYRLTGPLILRHTPAMKVLIQQAESEQYLTPQGTWTAATGNAQDFRFSSHAYAVVRREKVRGLRVVFYFEDLDYSIKAPRWKGRDPRVFQPLGATVFDV